MQERLLAQLAETEGVEGSGFVLAFRHISKVFRFGPEAETALNVRAWKTQGMAPLDTVGSQRPVPRAKVA